jgi:hypothetical protein
MSDYSEHGALPVEDGVGEYLPTEQEVQEAQERDFPEQAATAQHGMPFAESDSRSEEDEESSGA